MISKEELNAMALVFQSNTKKEILRLLLFTPQRKGMPFNEISLMIGGSKSNLHRHLTELVEAGILIREIGSTSSSTRLVMLHRLSEKHVEGFRKLEKLL